MNHWITKNFPTKLASLGLAVLFWFFVLSSQNTFFVYPQEIPIQAFNLPEGLAVVNDLGSVTLTVQAEGDLAQSLSADDFSVYVDLAGLAEGTKRVDVVVNVQQADVTIVRVSPERVDVTLEAVTNAEFPVVYSLEGDPAKNYEAFFLDNEPMTVLVQGASTVLQSIDTISAQVVLSGEETESFFKTVELVPLDANGEPVPNVTLEVEEIEVEVGVDRIQTQKTVGIKVNLAPPDDGWVESLTVVPAVVHIQGELEVLEAIDYLETETFTITSSQSTVETVVELRLPEGVTLVEGESDQVEVTVVIQRSLSDQEDS